MGGGGGGDTTQSNEATNSATAGNSNVTGQFVAQGQAASGSGAGQDQAASVDNAAEQSAYAGVYNGQYNIYAPVFVHSPGAGGNVTQSTSATNEATAGNSNGTLQGVGQGQAANGTGQRWSGQRQYASLFNTTGQSANAGVHNIQANIYAPVFVHSPGAGGGDVVQSNTASNAATAGNANATDQAVVQDQAGSGSGSGQGQSATVGNETYQSANAGVYNIQANIYAPVAVFSPGAGSGSVTQSNTASNGATAANSNDTIQGAGQGQASGGSSGSGQSQYATLFNTTVQSANGSIFNIQANIFAPVFVGSPGAGSGDVRQSNVASNRASAANLNRTFQLLLQGAGIHVLRV